MQTSMFLYLIFLLQLSVIFSIREWSCSYTLTCRGATKANYDIRVMWKISWPIFFHLVLVHFVGCARVETLKIFERLTLSQVLHIHFLSFVSLYFFMFTHLRMISSEQICEELAAENCNTLSYPQYVANAKWVTEALQHNLVVGTFNIKKRNVSSFHFERGKNFIIDFYSHSLTHSLTHLLTQGLRLVFCIRIWRVVFVWQ
jgi:hypothetical protein